MPLSLPCWKSWHSKTVPRFFVESIEGDLLTVTGDHARHIGRSLRMRPGEELTLCDTRGTDCLCVVETVSDSAVLVKVLERRPSDTEPTVAVTLYQGYPKGDKLETVIEKAVELGVTRIVPVLTERSVARPDDKSAARKQERWQRRALEAAKQCGRGIIPQVEQLIPFSQLGARMSAHDTALFCYELGGIPLSKSPVTSGTADVGIFIGPEGGISHPEAQALTEAGAVAVTLGPRILRTETAPLAALTAVMLLSGNMD